MENERAPFGNVFAGGRAWFGNAYGSVMAFVRYDYGRSVEEVWRADPNGDASATVDGTALVGKASVPFRAVLDPELRFGRHWPLPRL